jgi:DNA-binding transcriptional LysR family regulator
MRTFANLQICIKAQRMDWDNLRYFLELARSGTLMSAARRLEVDHTTVARRIQALEKEVGAPLFSRESGGHRLTEAGRRLQPQVEAMESAFRRPSRAPRRPRTKACRAWCASARPRASAPWCWRRSSRCSRQHPKLTIDLLAMPRLVHLSRREADIVISLERPARGPVVVTKLTDYTLRLYASKKYLAKHKPIKTREDLRGHTFISYVDDLLFSKELQYLDELHKPDTFALRSTSILAQHAAVAAGAGIAVLPAFIAERDGVAEAGAAPAGQFHAHVLDVDAGRDQAPGAHAGGVGASCARRRGAAQAESGAR